MKIIILFILLAVVLATLYHGTGFIRTGFYRGPVSDHFDGTHFFNVDKKYQKKSIWNVFKWMLTRSRKPWPVINNTPTAKVMTVDRIDRVRVTFVNHSTVLLQTAKVNFLTDPVWSERTSPFAWVGTKRVKNPGVTFSDLPRIDVVVISHNHYDHLDIQTLKKLDEKFHPVFLVPLGNKSLLRQYGISNVVEMDWWQEYKIKNSIITFLPARHWSARWLNDRFKTLWGSYGIEVAGKKFYFAGDTGYGSHFNDIKSRWGKPDIAFLPIGAYQPEWFMRDNHLNPSDAIQAHLDLAAQQSIGIHFNTFQLSDEAIDQPAQDLKQAIKTHHLNNDTFILLQEGESKNF